MFCDKQMIIFLTKSIAKSCLTVNQMIEVQIFFAQFTERQGAASKTALKKFFWMSGEVAGQKNIDFFNFLSPKVRYASCTLN